MTPEEKTTLNIIAHNRSATIDLSDEATIDELLDAFVALARFAGYSPEIITRACKEFADQ